MTREHRRLRSAADRRRLGDPRHRRAATPSVTRERASECSAEAENSLRVYLAIAPGFYGRSSRQGPHVRAGSRCDHDGRMPVAHIQPIVFVSTETFAEPARVKSSTC